MIEINKLLKVKQNHYSDQKILFIHLSSIGVNAPYIKGNFNDINYKPFNKFKINYNSYELSKACGEYVLKKNVFNLQNISTVIIQPSNIIFENCNFLKKLRIFLYLLPFKIPYNLTVPITQIDYLLDYIVECVNSKNRKKLIIKKLYKKVKIQSLFNNNKFLSFF